MTLHPKILLIEDEDCLRQSLVIMLSAEGYEVVDAEDGSIGVNLALTESPDLVICDLRMPRLSGDEVLDILRHEPATKATPFICMSSDEQESMPMSVKSLGGEHFLQKPFSRRDLLWAINRHLCPAMLAS